METINGNGATFKIKQENDGWWSVYQENAVTHELSSVIQAKDREHAILYINMIEVINVPFNVI